MTEAAPQRPAAGELEVFAILEPEHVGQLPKDIFAIQQTGTFEGTEGHAKTVIELTHSKARVDQAVENVREYGDPDRRYRVYYGRIVWESEGDVVPVTAPVQTLFDVGMAPKKGKKK